jgi:hypothetical protein
MEEAEGLCGHITLLADIRVDIKEEGHRSRRGRDIQDCRKNDKLNLIYQLISIN